MNALSSVFTMNDAVDLLTKKCADKRRQSLEENKEAFLTHLPCLTLQKPLPPLLFKFLRLMEIKPVWCVIQTPCRLGDQIKELVYLSVRFGG